LRWKMKIKKSLHNKGLNTFFVLLKMVLIVLNTAWCSIINTFCGTLKLVRKWSNEKQSLIYD
jgi:hypothetical protein